jgi:hypothetical protein
MQNSLPNARDIVNPSGRREGQTCGSESNCTGISKEKNIELSQQAVGVAEVLRQLIPRR